MNKRTNIIIKILVAFICVGFVKNTAYAQVKRPLSEADKTALEGIIIEKYYEYTTNDMLDTTGGSLPKGSVTYRIYVDMKPNYTLQAVYGVLDHPLFIKTTTQFFNNTEQGQGTGDYVNDKKIMHNTAALDSWLTIGAATKSHIGIPKADDKDGSILQINSLSAADGLLAKEIKAVTYFGIIPNFFNTTNTANTFSTSNGSWAMFGGIKGPTDDNKVLIAQLTTDGALSFELNLQIGTPTGGNVNYVAKNPEDMEIKFDALTKK